MLLKLLEYKNNVGVFYSIIAFYVLFVSVIYLVQTVFYVQCLSPEF